MRYDHREEMKQAREQKGVGSRKYLNQGWKCLRNIKDFKEKLLSVNGMILSLSLSMIFLALKRSLKKKYRFASGRVLL